MAKRYGKGTLELKGFDEYIQNLQDVGGKLEREGKECFLECTKEVTTQLRKKSKEAGLKDSLRNTMKSETILHDSAGVWYFEAGWQKGKPNYKNLSDAYKVLFYNYGTPRRSTKKGANRGKIQAHGFIGNAKRAAYRRCKKIQSEFLANVTKGL